MSSIADVVKSQMYLRRLIIKALADKKWMLRLQAARGLGNLGFRSEEAFVALTNAIHDENGTVREQVSASLMKIDPNSASQAGAK